MARLRSVLTRFPLVLLAMLALAGSAGADSIVIPEISFQAGVEGGTLGVDLMNITSSMIQGQIDGGTATAVDNGDGSYTVTGLSFMMASNWSLDISTLTLDPDPFVSFVGGFTNLAAAAQDFILSTVLPVAPLAPSTLIGGSTIVTYADANFDAMGGLTNSTGGGAGYSGTIDGSNALNMLAAFSLTPAFAGDATQFATETQGLPGPTLPGPAAAATIGITHRFNLSSNDQATFNSTFQVVVVPEPATGLLLSLGLVAVATLRRRAP